MNRRITDQTASATRDLPRSKQTAMLAVIILGAAACIGIVAWQLLGPGPFEWHVELPRFWQGGIEALVLMATLGAVQALRSKSWRFALSAMLAELYLRRHAVDAAVIVDMIYLELAIALGALVLRLCGAARANDIVTYLRCFVLGLCIWSVCAWSLSAFGWGSLRGLRWMTLVLLLPALAARPRPWSLFVDQRVAAMPVSTRIGIGVLIAWFLILFAHSATAIGFDSQWYGLRGDRVLVGAGSVFAAQGLVAPVYYFPKVYELFLIPMSGFGSVSVIVGVTILILGLLAAAAYELLRLLGVRETLPRLAGVGLVVSLPAVANIALEAKPDLLAVLLLMLAWIHASDFVTARRRSSLLWLLGLLIFSTQAKLTAIPFAAALFLATLIAALCNRSVRQNSTSTEMRVASTGLTLILIVGAFATARTMLLAGMPTIGPDQLFNLWRALGLSLSFPVGTLQWSVAKDWADTPTLILDFLVRPQHLMHIMIMWTGNVWLWLAAVAACTRVLLPYGSTIAVPGTDAMEAGPMKISSRSSIAAGCWPGIGLMLTAFLLMLCWGFMERGGDGNYFIAGLIPSILLGFAASWMRLGSFASLSRSLLFASAAFCFFQGSYSFASASWTGGTRPFDLQFRNSARTFRHESRRIFREDGLFRIAEYLRGLHRNARVIGCTSDSDLLGMRLPASFENFPQISFAHPEYVDSDTHFIDFLKADHIEYLLLPRPENKAVDCSGDARLLELAADLENNSAVTATRDDGYILYNISEAWSK